MPNMISSKYWLAMLMVAISIAQAPRWLRSITNMASQAREPRFRKIKTFKTDYSPTVVTQYQSERSGMHVMVADRQGPKVNGYFTLATEIWDDSGAPHTLEHICFMGSEGYRYKGLLDKLAGRAYSRTNAWTATDHTAYSLDSAGWAGFSQILPVYLEHVVLPIITDDACLTEVHHIDGEGKDAGVVYSEMQAIQNTNSELMILEAKRLIYPENIGFRYETGGMMEALRTLTPSGIREFHKSMYHPRNMAVILVGEVDHTHLLRILDEFEDSIQNDIPLSDGTYKRPFIDSPQPPALQKTVLKTVEFPEEDESTGEVYVAYLGPSSMDRVLAAAMDVLMTFLCGSSASVLENIMVEKEQLASSISWFVEHRPNMLISLAPTGVETSKLAAVEKRLVSLLKEVASKPLDMTYMKECTRRTRRKLLLQSEESEDFWSGSLINDYLFGTRDGATLEYLQSFKEYDTLNSWTEEQWRDFLKTWISDAHHVSILGKPSKKLASDLEKSEEVRIKKRKDELGPEGLKKLQGRVDEAKKNNEIPIPPELLDRWPVPPPSSIHLLESETARSGRARDLGTGDGPAQKIIDAAAPGLPLFIQFENVPSNFVRIVVCVGTGGVPTKLKPLLNIMEDNFFNTPVMRNGVRMEFEDMVKQLETDTVSNSVENAEAWDSQGMWLALRVEPEGYETAIEWLRILMFDSIFDPDRLKASVAKALADVPEDKRDGNVMTKEVSMAIHTVPEAKSAASRTLVEAVYLRRLRSLLKEDPDTVVSWFEELRRALFQMRNLRVFVAGDTSKLPNPVAAWDALAKQAAKADRDASAGAGAMTPIVEPHELRSAEGVTPGSYGAVVVPIAAVDGSYSISTAAGLKSFNDPRVPAYWMALYYLDTIEGPLWMAVRGNGLAYGTRFSKNPDTGLTSFRVYRSPNAAKALEATRQAVARLASGEDPIDRHVLEIAVSSVALHEADWRSSFGHAALSNFINGVLRGVEADWNTKLLDRMQKVTPDEVRAVLRDLVLPVLQPGTSNLVVTCAPMMQENMAKELEEMGYKVQVQPLSHFHEDYGLKGGENSDEDDSEDDEHGDTDGSAEKSESDEADEADEADL